MRIRGGTVLAAAAALAAALAAAGHALVQEPVTLQGGHPYDAETYYAMAERAAAGGSAAATAPFAYRVALPYLAGTLFPRDIDFGFKLLNLLFALLTAAVFYLFLRSFRLRPETSLLLLLCLVCMPQAPFRFAHYLPAYTDPPALFFVLLFLYLARAPFRLNLPRSAAIAALAVVGVLFREIALCGILAFAFARCAELRGGPPFLFVRSRRLAGLCLLPMAAAVGTVALLHGLVDGAGAYRYSETMLGVLGRHLGNPDAFALAWLMSFGAIPLLLLLLSGPLRGFLAEHQFVAVFLAGGALLALFGGYHTDRIAFWSYPAVLLLFGVLLERRPLGTAPAGFKLALFVPLIAVQALAWRVWLPIPDDPDGELLDPGMPPVMLFSAFGDATLGHTYASFLPAPARLVLLGQYLAFGAYLWAALRLLARNPARAERRSPAGEDMNREAPSLESAQRKALGYLKGGAAEDWALFGVVDGKPMAPLMSLTMERTDWMHTLSAAVAHAASKLRAGPAVKETVPMELDARSFVQVVAGTVFKSAVEVIETGRCEAWVLVALDGAGRGLPTIMAHPPPDARPSRLLAASLDFGAEALSGFAVKPDLDL